MNPLSSFPLSALFLLTVCTTLHVAVAREPAEKIIRPGLPNFYRVTSNLYRGAQPTADGLRAAEKLGVKTVIDLRAFHSDTDEGAGTQLALEHISFKTWHPEDEDVIRFLKLATAKKNQPVFVHCQHGSDRTGTMIAIYRIAVQGWAKRDAIDEMTKGNFGFHPVWKNLIAYIEKLDIESLRKRAGLAK